MVLAGLTAAAPLGAVTPIIWTGLTGGSVSTATNWTDNTLPSSGANVEFTSTVTHTTISFTGPGTTTFGDVTFSGTGRPAYSFGGTGSPVLALNGSVTVGDGGTVTFASSLDLQLSAATHQISVDGSTTLSVSSVVSGAGGGINKTGTGTLALLASNSYTGGTTLSGGTLVIESNASLGNSSAALTFAGGTLRNNQAITLVRSIIVGANGGTFDTNTQNLAISGVISGSGNLLVTGGATLTLTGANTYTGTTTMKDGILKIGDNGTTGTHPGNIALDNSGTNNPSVVFSRSDAYTYAGVISGNSGTANAVTVSSTAATTFTGAHSYSGNTLINGTLLLGSGSKLGSGAVTVSNGTLGLLSGASISNTTTINSGGKIIGTGTISTLTVNNGGKIAPGDPIGNQIGTLTFSDLTLAGGSTYELHILNPTGTVGEDLDSIKISSSDTLRFTADANTKFNLKLISLTSTTVAGTATGFSQQNYNWEIASSASIVGFSSGIVAIDSSDFSTNLGTGGAFALSTQGTSLMLSFTPVPEPSQAALLLAGAGLLGWRLARRRNAVR